jgi:hypothetical protein
VTLRAILGLVALSVLYLGVGSCLLWALGVWSSWRRLVRLAGLAYLVGVASLGVLWVLLLVAGVPFGGVAIVASALAVAAGATAVGRRWGRRWPKGWGPRLVLTKLSLISAVGVALTGVLLEALFRAARLQGLVAFDAWTFWIPKAKAIYFFGELDEQFFTQLHGPTYPPLVPVIDVAAFHAMGSADVVTLHVQYAVFVAAFVLGAAGLLWRHVPGWILWPFLVLTLVAPRTSGQLLTPQADFLLQFFFCAAAIVAALWLLERASWQLPVVCVLLGAAVLSKREGVLLAAVLLVALTVASWDLRRTAWPKIGLVALGVAAAGLPWRLWYRHQGISGEASTGVETDRAPEALRLALEVFFDPRLWSVLALLAVVVVPLAAVWGERRQAVFVGTMLALIVLGGAWISVAYPELPVTAEEALNPIVRYTGSAALLAGVASPLLLAGIWGRVGPPASGGRELSERGIRRLAAAIVVVPLIVFPLVAAAGGAPELPSRDECARVARGDEQGEVEVVYARLDELAAAEELLAELTAIGFVGAGVELDGCGRWKVSYDAIESFAQGQALVEEVRRAGFDARVEIEG